MLLVDMYMSQRRFGCLPSTLPVSQGYFILDNLWKDKKSR